MAGSLGGFGLGAPDGSNALCTGGGARGPTAGLDRRLVYEGGAVEKNPDDLVAVDRVRAHSPRRAERFQVGHDPGGRAETAVAVTPDGHERGVARRAA